MGQSATELRRDIERTREGLGETLDAIGDRVSPGRIVERRKNRMTSGLRTAKERIMGTIDDATQAVSERAHDLGDDATDALDQMKEMPSGVRERTQGAPMIAGAIAFGVGLLLFLIVWWAGRDDGFYTAQPTLPGKAAPVEALPEPLSTGDGASGMEEPAPRAASDERPQLVEEKPMPTPVPEVAAPTPPEATAPVAPGVTLAPGVVPVPS